VEDELATRFREIRESLAANRSSFDVIVASAEAVEERQDKLTLESGCGGG
jgi:hypothetical protein